MSSINVPYAISFPLTNDVASTGSVQSASVGLWNSFSNINSVIENRDYEQNTPLLLAAKQNSFDDVKRFLETGSNPNCQNIYGETALLCALTAGCFSMAHLLLQYGANPHLCLLESGGSPLHYASTHEDISILEALLQAGAFINTQDIEGDSVLHWAIREGKLQAVKFLLEKGANPNTTNDDGETPLHLAVQCGECEIVDFLLRNGSNPALRDAEGMTAFDIALETRDTDIVQLLAKRPRRSPSCSSSSSSCTSTTATCNSTSPSSSANTSPRSCGDPVDFRRRVDSLSAGLTSGGSF
eukprot:TRINITY_DN2111_c0_g1_i1.p1 TRINITY_DN2111_c0_g1~~TRINITY_DN2111_c0_g1_i1.p1  ORF type:complete len:298 (+),score=49.13 TRINITY_DN2111_c0_g1_i1:248-1141(+)